MYHKPRFTKTCDINHKTNERNDLGDMGIILKWITKNKMGGCELDLSCLGQKPFMESYESHNEI